MLDFANYWVIIITMEKNIHKKFQPLVISGCSGVGKGTIIKNLLQQFPQLFELSVSYTTRLARPGQVHGKDYFFVSKAQFQKLVKEGGFLQHCQNFGNLYGTSRSFVQSIIAKRKICLLDVDIQGAEKIYKQHSQWRYVFITPPSLEILEDRLRGRGTETQDQINKRLATASKQLDALKSLKFYEILTNDIMEVFYKDFIKFINHKYELLIEIQK